MVRLDLSIELRKNKKRYLEVFASEKRFNEIKHGLVSELVGRAFEDQWMIMPDMSFLVAKRYKSVVVLLTRNEFSKTFIDCRPVRFIAGEHTVQIICIVARE
jgi:hypothetical protein